jgi:hypothetical protein
MGKKQDDSEPDEDRKRPANPFLRDNKLTPNQDTSRQNFIPDSNTIPLEELGESELSELGPALIKLDSSCREAPPIDRESLRQIAKDISSEYTFTASELLANYKIILEVTEPETNEEQKQKNELLEILGNE